MLAYVRTTTRCVRRQGRGPSRSAPARDWPLPVRRAAPPRLLRYARGRPRSGGWRETPGVGVPRAPVARRRGSRAMSRRALRVRSAVPVRRCDSRLIVPFALSNEESSRCWAHAVGREDLPRKYRTSGFDSVSVASFFSPFVKGAVKPLHSNRLTGVVGARGSFEQRNRA